MSREFSSSGHLKVQQGEVITLCLRERAGPLSGAVLGSSLE